MRGEVGGGVAGVWGCIAAVDPLTYAEFAHSRRIPRGALDRTSAKPED